MSPSNCEPELGFSYPTYYKYWAQRYRLFSKYDEGILLDEEGWYSVTPELIAAHIARRIWNSTLRIPTPHVGWRSPKKRRKEPVPIVQRHPMLVLDAFCGPGGNTIQLAKAAPHGGLVFAIDIDPTKILMAKHNASVYGVQQRIEFIIGDAIRLAPHFRNCFDAVFLSPPWGGPEYSNSDIYALSDLQPIPGDQMYTLFRDNVSPNLAMLLPRNIQQEDLITIAGPNKPIEIEANYLSHKLKTVTAYYGDLTDPSKEKVDYTGSSLDIQEFPVVWLDEEFEEEE